jgi:type II secretory pathway component PulL
VDVDAVEQGTADLLAVVLDLADGAAALAFRIAAEAARAWVSIWVTTGMKSARHMKSVSCKLSRQVFQCQLWLMQALEVMLPSSPPSLGR